MANGVQDQSFVSPVSCTSLGQRPPVLLAVAGGRRRGSHDHEKQEHPETGELVAAWKIKKGKVKRKEKGKEAYGWMDGYLTSATTRVRASKIG